MRTLLVILLIFLPLSFSQAQDLTQEQSRKYRKKGYRLQSMGDLEAALPFYQKAVEIDPGYVQAYNDLGVLYEMEGVLGEAEQYYKQALAIDPDFMPAHTNLAFLYEKKNNIKKATDHWKKRYIKGKKGDYWKEVARQHLLKLGTYPEVRKEMMEEKAASLSRELIYQREQKRLEVLEEAKLHFKLGERAFQEKDYPVAIKELRKVLSLNPSDLELKTKARKVFKRAKRFQLRQEAFVNAKDALDYMENNDYLSATAKLKSALNAVFRITQSESAQE
ncbi:MAG: tetratricopeptide repeat protein [Candidatus Omnitrophica bacterium]|nr:tetratricopeptide repeat protein [Candidatus Omnitrophota bacterium]MCF7891974.1 tetratricopeptide repeat protein [Candidatus Omnitrophota bacterium]MCF7898156.1 tetratricopeptide repeat protein [Candidatus Omnitrophota bacterium]MCF7909877.1 tetratricopeptide repeat protein [Candidatus Omnitrophota bacterium]